MLERRWFPLETVGDLRAARTSSRRSSCAPCRRRWPASRSIVVCTPPRAPASSPPRRGCSEWTRSGRSAVRRRSAGSRTSSASTRSSGPGNAYVNEAKLEVSRDVAIDLPGGPSEVVVVADRRRSAPRRARARRAGRARARRRLPASSRRSRRRRRSRPSISCCSASPRRAPARCGTPAPSSSGPGRRSPAGDYATGGNHVLPTSGWARSVGGLGLETFLKPVTMQRLTREGLARDPADGRGARRGRGACPRTPRRCGDEGARARVPAVRLGDDDGRGRARSRASTRRRSCASTRTRRRCRSRRRGPGTIARRTRRDQQLPARRLRAARRAIADYAGVEPENIVLGAGADDLILLCARAFAGPGDAIAIPPAPTYPLYRIAAQLAGAEVGGDDPVLTFACRPNNPTGALDAAARGAAARRRRGRTSSTAARRRSR